jgi:AhpD family alkylhydroperoxidase
MKPRINILHAAPAGYKAVLGLEQYVRSSGIEPKTLELIKIRASQINGCAYCIDMHTKDARAAGETEQRIYSLDAWHETPFYSDKERAVLALTEAVTLIREGHVPDAVFEEARSHFNEAELMNLTLAIATINLWNRLAITFRSVPGEYQPQKSVQTSAVA